MTRIALVHATRVAIDPIEKAARHNWPEVETISILEEGLSVDRRKSPLLSDDLSQRIAALTRYAESTGANGVLFTCSAFGPAIDDAARESMIPVMKPNEAMFDAAFAYGDRIAMIYTFPPAAEGMEQEFQEAAQKRESSAQLSSYFCENALAALQAGRVAEHHNLIATTAAEIEDADVIMLAQFSMADAASAVRSATPIPVLTSPEAALYEMRRRINAQNETSKC